MLDDHTLEQLLKTANELGMFVLLEGFDGKDLERMAPYASDQVLLGLNCRDLTTLKIDPQRFVEFADHFPSGAIKAGRKRHSLSGGGRPHSRARLRYGSHRHVINETGHPGQTISDIRKQTAATGS